MRGRKPKWLPKIKELLKVEPLTQAVLLKRLGCSKGRLSEILKEQIEKGTITEVTNAHGERAYVLSPSVEVQLIESIVFALRTLPLYPLETVAASYTTLSEGDYMSDISVAMGVNFIMQQQYSHRMAKILGQYPKEKRLRLLRAFANAALNGFHYCLDHNIDNLESKIRNQIRGHPQRTFQVIRKNLVLFLKYGLKDLAPSFVQKESHLRLLASELEKILAEDYFPAMRGRTNELVKLLRRESELLRGFLDQLGQTKFILVVPFGFPELEEPYMIYEAGNLQSFDSWMQRLKEGTLDMENASFLFNNGARNLKRFIDALGDPSLEELRDVDPSKLRESKRKQLRCLLVPPGIYPMEEEQRLWVDLREPWDLLFLFGRHPRGEQPEFYSEILSLVRKRRDEATRRGFVVVPSKEKAIRKIIHSRNGFLIYYKGQETPEIIGPSGKPS